MASIKRLSSKTRGTRYKATVRLAGHPTQCKTFSRLSDARAWAARIEAEIRQGRALRQRLLPDISIEEALERYVRLTASHKKPSTRERDRHTAKRLKAGLGGLAMREITPSVAAAYRDDRLKRVAASTVRIELAMLSHMYEIAAREWGMEMPNPIKKIDRPPPGKGRTRFLTREEAARLLTECKCSKNRRLYPLVLLLLHTGMRPGEAASLRWEQVDMDAGMIRLTETKTGLARSIPLTRKAMQALEALPRNGRLVFLPDRLAEHARPTDHFRTAFRTALKRAKIHDFRLYDLRHTAASYLLMAGVDIRTLAEILGHRTMQMVMRYTHLLDAHKREAISALEGLGDADQ